MSIVGTNSASRQRHSGFQTQHNSSSRELAFTQDESEDDIVTEYSDLKENISPFLANRPLLDLDPRSAVAFWRIAALGRRPQDYLARDLLLNSLWRDERPRVFHSLVKKPPAWIEDHVRHLPGTQDKQATQLTVLHYLHRRQLTRLWNRDDTSNRIGTEGRRVLTRLGECWPYGAKVEPPAPVETTPHGCWCRLAWLCPWCYARRAVGLERLLRAGPLRNPQGKHLVLARLATCGEQASPNPDWNKRSETHYLQGPRKVRRMRSAVTAKFRRFARHLGITGGIITHQISPWRTQDYRKGVEPGLASFRHDYALLGEVTFADEDQADRFREKTVYRSHPYGVIHIGQPDLAFCYQFASVCWSCHAADDPNVDTLRLFLAGSSTDYPVSRLEWHVGGLTEGRLTSDGVRGALTLQPHFMMDEVQWWSYAEATRGLPLYVPFGSWRSAIGETKCQRAERHKPVVLLPLPARRPVSRRRQGLKVANAQRKQQSQEELDRLVEVARPLLKQVMAEPTGRRGRPAHRARLKGLLEQQGYVVSAHRLKRLVQELGS